MTGGFLSSGHFPRNHGQKLFVKADRISLPCKCKISPSISLGPHILSVRNLYTQNQLPAKQCHQEVGDPQAWEQRAQKLNEIVHCTYRAKSRAQQLAANSRDVFPPAGTLPRGTRRRPVTIHYTVLFDLHSAVHLQTPMAEHGFLFYNVLDLNKQRIRRHYPQYTFLKNVIGISGFYITFIFQQNFFLSFPEIHPFSQE